MSEDAIRVESVRESLLEWRVCRRSDDVMRVDSVRESL